MDSSNMPQFPSQTLPSFDNTIPWSKANIDNLVMDFEGGIQVPARFVSTSAQPEYRNWSLDEIRLPDYESPLLWEKWLAPKYSNRTPYEAVIDETAAMDEKPTRLMCITNMSEYKNFSLEELRFLEYRRTGKDKPRGLFSYASGFSGARKRLAFEKGSSSKITTANDKEQNDLNFLGEAGGYDSVFRPPSEKRLKPSKTDSCCVKQTNPKIFTVPSLKVLNLLTINGKCIVSNFQIVHAEHGSITFPGKMDVYGMNLDDVFEFSSRSITIYGNVDTIPPYGTGFNRPAEVTLRHVWPKDKNSPSKLITRPNDPRLLCYENKLKEKCKRCNWKFLRYDMLTGFYSFKIQLSPEN